MSRSSVARIVPSSIGISYCCPVRLSVIVSDSLPVATPAPSCFPLVSVVIALLLRGCRGGLARTRPSRATTTQSNTRSECAGSGRRAGARSVLLAGHDRHRHGDGHQHEADQHDSALPAVVVRKAGAG